MYRYVILISEVSYTSPYKDTPMRIKDVSVEMEIHPTLTKFLFMLDDMYRGWGSELTITSGSEHTAKHGHTSLHYAKPGCAVDTRTWPIITPREQHIDANRQFLDTCLTRDVFCKIEGIPSSWIDIIHESNHLHIEYQPKRPANL